MIRFFKKLIKRLKTKEIKDMNQQDQINWLIRQVNRMNNSHCGDGCDYTIPEGCVVWTGEPLMCGETILANEGDRMDVVQQNIVAFLCSKESNTYSIIANEICVGGGFSFLENGVVVYSQCFSSGETYNFEINTKCPNGGFLVKRGKELIFNQCYECCGGGSQLIHYEEATKGLLISDSDSDTLTVPGSSLIAYKTELTRVISPSDGPGIYESLFSGSLILQEGKDFYIGVYVNSVMENTFQASRVASVGIGTMSLIQTLTTFKSNIALNVGDQIGIAVFNSTGTSIPILSIQQHKWKLSKIG